jgi:hypothetical protein
MWTILDHHSNCRGSRAGCNDLGFAGDTPAATGIGSWFLVPKTM